MLAYDKSVDVNKRDSGEQFSRAAVEQWFSMFTIYDLQSAESFLSAICGNVLQCKTPQEVYATFADQFRNCKRIALESAARENHLPLWIKTIIEGEL